MKTTWPATTRVAVFSALIALSSVGCRGASSATTTPRAADREREFVAQTQAAMDRARTDNVVNTVAALFAPQGMYLSPYPGFMRGPDGARTWLTRDTLNAKSRARWVEVHHGLSADGRDAYSYGYFDVVHPAGDTLFGKFQAYWRRAENGKWQLLAFSRGRRAPGAATAAMPAALAAMAAEHETRSGSRADTAVSLREMFDTEGMFADSSAVSVGAAFSGFAAPDVAKLEGGAEFVFGPQAIGQLFANPPAGSLGPMWKPETGSAATTGDLGFTLGPAWARQPGKTQNQPANSGRYFTIWKRQPSGDWRFVVD